MGADFYWDFGQNPNGAVLALEFSEVGFTRLCFHGVRTKRTFRLDPEVERMCLAIKV
jgi:hypothetical protein